MMYVHISLRALDESAGISCFSILHNVFDDGSNWVRVSGFILSLKFATLFVFQ